MERSPNKMNILQLSEHSEYSVDKIFLLIEERLVSGPINGFSFTSENRQELENIRAVMGSGYSLECDRHTSYNADRFTVG